MKDDIEYLTNKRSARWRINFRAPIWIIILIVVGTFLFNGYTHEGYSEGLKKGEPISTHSLRMLSHGFTQDRGQVAPSTPPPFLKLQLQK